MRLTMLAAIFGLTISLEERDRLNSAMRQTAAKKPNDVELQTAIAQALQMSPLTADSLIVVHVNQGGGYARRGRRQPPRTAGKRPAWQKQCSV